MKIFTIQELIENDKNNILIVGYLFYYEKAKEFYIELLDNLDEWDMPLILSSLYKRGIRTINSYWSKVWVSQRIVPTDRQNIGQILRDNKLKQYDEFNILILNDGRCAQDNYYLKEIDEIDLPKPIVKRFEKRIIDILNLDNNLLLVFFKNGKIKEFDLKKYINSNSQFNVIKNNEGFIKYFKILVGGYGIAFDDFHFITSEVIYDVSMDITMSLDIMNNYIEKNVLTTSDVMNELNCSRQYVNELVKTEKLKPIKSSEKNTLFLKKDVMELCWK